MAKLRGTWLTIANEIDAVFKKHNFTRQNFRVSHGLGGDFRLTITGQEATASGEKAQPFAKAAAGYQTCCALLGFKPEWLNQPFNYGGKTYVLRGYDGSKPKNCMVLERDGKRYGASDITVKRAIESSQRKAA